MTTAQIETRADIGQLASGDVDLRVLLRREVIPQFLTDVGNVEWRRAFATVTTTPNQQADNLPSDFMEMAWVRIGPDYATELFYIGEDQTALVAAETNTVAGKPTGYYFIAGNSKAVEQIKWDVVPNAAYAMRLCYWKTIPFSDDTSSVDLNKYIPEQFQWGIVYRLKAALLEIRLGVGDPRFASAMKMYEGELMKARQRRLGPVHTPRSGA